MRPKPNLTRLALVAALFGLNSAVNPQTGGDFTVTQSVVASGGAQNLAGGTFSIDGTAGQSNAGQNSTGGAFAVRGGFWTPPLAPSAAGVSLSGRVLTPGATAGLRGATVRLTPTHGTSRTTLSTSFGYYRFDDLTVGETYVISVASKRFSFSPRVLSVVDEVTELDLIAEP